MDNGTFSKVEKSSKAMYGPRRILLCGYTKEEQKVFCSVLNKIKTADIPVTFVGDPDSSRTLRAILEKTKTVDTEHSSLRRAVVMSGLTQTELHDLIGIHRESGLPSPLWASLTPVSETWLLKDLLEALEQEATAMKKRRVAARGDSAKQT